MKIKNKLLASAAALLMCGSISFQAQAAPISVSDSQLQTTSGQNFNFSFGGLPNPGTNGVLDINLRGDYSGFTTESAFTTVDIAGGSLDIGDTANGVISNSIAGLSLISSSKTTHSYNDVSWDFSFSMSDILLNLAIADGIFTTSVNLDSGVNNFATSSFVAVGLTYESVPEPASLALFALGLAGLGYRRRKAL